MTNVSVTTNEKGELHVTVDVSGSTKYTVELRNYETCGIDLTTIKGGGSGKKKMNVVGGDLIGGVSYGGVAGGYPLHPGVPGFLGGVAGPGVPGGSGGGGYPRQTTTWKANNDE